MIHGVLVCSISSKVCLFGSHKWVVSWLPKREHSAKTNNLQRPERRRRPPNRHAIAQRFAHITVHRIARRIIRVHSMREGRLPIKCQRPGVLQEVPCIWDIQHPTLPARDNIQPSINKLLMIGKIAENWLVPEPIMYWRRIAVLSLPWDAGAADLE